MADSNVKKYLHDQWIDSITDPSIVIFKITRRKKKDRQGAEDTRIFNDYMTALWCGGFNPPKGVMAEHMDGYIGYKPLSEIMKYIDR
jgi:hypothetical protein